VDTSTPSVAISAPANGSTTNDNTPQITFSVTEANPGTTECRVDGGAWSTCTSGDSLATLTDGSHTLDVRHTDAAGNVGSSSSTFTVDTTNPVVAISAPANGSTTNDNTPQITFSVTEANPGTTECRVDGGAWAACASGNSLATLTDGSHTLDVRHTDALGNVGADSTTFTVDTTPPAAPTISSPAEGATLATATVTFTGTAEPGATVRVYVDGNLIGTVTANGSGAWSLTSPALADGPHNVAATATDAGGNVGPSSALTNFTIDTTPPELTVTARPVSNPADSPVFDIATGGGTASLSCSLDGAAFAPCSSPYTPPVLEPGTHTLVVRAVDAVGNVTERTMTFVIGSDTQQCPSGGATEGVPAKVKVLSVRMQNKKLRFDISTDKFVMARISVYKPGSKKALGSSARAANAGSRSIFLRVKKFPKKNATLSAALETVTEDGGRSQAVANLTVDAKGGLTLAPLSDRNGGEIVGTPCGAAGGAKKVKLVSDSDTRIAGLARVKFRAKSNQLSVMTVLVEQNGELLGRRVFVLQPGKRIVKPVQFFRGKKLRKGAFTITFRTFSIEGVKMIKTLRMKAR
jgi:hypothetical protein